MKVTLEESALPQVLSLAVHELRTPVSVIAGYLRMLLREQGGPLSEKQRKMLEEAERSCVRVNALVGEMSELGRLESKDLSIGRHALDLAALVSDVVSDMHEGAERGVRLEVRAAAGPLMVAADRTKLTAATKAVIHTALRERGEPGVVVATCVALHDTSPRWAVVAVSDESMLETLVNTARGTLPPFDEWRGGVGLALPVARRLVEALGGAMWSAPGERPRAGSAFRLPLRD